MGNAHDFFARVERFCADQGISPATLCGRATGNARLFGRMKRRAAQLGQRLAEIWKSPTVIDNRAGAGGVEGALRGIGGLGHGGVRRVGVGG